MAVTKVVMPKLSEQMETGKIIKWLKQEGDRVQSGDILAEVETDKADVEMEAFGAGLLRKILVPAGGAVPVGALIGVIAEPGDDIAAVVGAAGGTPPAPVAQATEMAARPAEVPPQPRREDQAARDRGIPTFGITDGNSTPVAMYCDGHLIAPIHSPSYTGSYVAPMALINTIILACAHLRPKRALAMLGRTEAEYRSGERWYQDPPRASNGSRTKRRLGNARSV